MPPGAIDDQTRATSTVGGDNETRVYKFSVPGVNLLRDGQNVLAVELHQAGTNSTDTYLDLALSTERRTSWFIANLPEETLDQALAAAGEILPEGLVDSWTSALRFALAPTVAADSATDVDARQWMARARIQQALGRYAEAMAALNRELELLRSDSSPAAVARRYALELEVEQVFIQLGQSQEVRAWSSQRFADELATMRAYRINCGGATFLDTQGDTWGADRRFLTGATSNLGGEIEGTDDDELYRTHRWSFNPNNSQDLRLYSLPAPNGSYQVTLLFADTQSPRSVDVMLEDRVVLQGYDIVQAVGARQADRRSFQITVSDGQLDIGFSTQSGSALVSGIEVKKLD
jgi:hypothetical protein